MSNARTLITPPYAEPLSLTEAKLHLRIESSVTDDDALISALLTAAREYVEDFTRRRLVAQTWDVKFDGFPCSGYGFLRLPYPPMMVVSSITYIDTAGATQTWAASNYIVDTDSEPARIGLAYGQVWPVTQPVLNAVTVRFVCGYATPFTVNTTNEFLTLQGRNAPAANTAVRVWSTAVPPSGLKTLSDYYVINPSGSLCQLAATSGGGAIDLTSPGPGDETHFMGIVPESIRAAIKLILGDLYENRERGMTGIYTNNPAVDALLWSNRLLSAV